MAYAIMRIKKIKSNAEFSKVMDHNYRLVEVLNADKDLAYRNSEIIKLEHDTYADAFNDKIKNSEFYKTNNIRKNAVRGLEVLLTYTEDYSRDINLERWKEENKKWITKTFGKDNVISMMYHGDESTPHIHAMVIPMVDGRLNAYHILGNRQKMRGLQDSYAKAMESFGLERGLRNSVAKHIDIQKFYAALNRELEKELPKPLINESLDEYRFRANEEYQLANVKHYNEKLSLQRTVDVIKTEMRNKDIDHKSKLKEFQNRLNNYKKLEREFGSQEKIEITLSNARALKSGLEMIKKEKLDGYENVDGLLNYLNEVTNWKKEKDKELAKYQEEKRNEFKG